MAEREKLPFVAVAAAGEEPYEAVPAKVADYLAEDGIDVRAFKPRRVEAAQLESAVKVVSIDCDLAKLDTRGVKIDEWTDVPKVSDDLPGSASAIRRHVEALLQHLRHSRQ
jgi:hypothetical protein